MKNFKYFLIVFLALSTFIKIQAADYYWVGGSGNWNDINHWRTTSGGAAIPSVIPGVTDNVYFDANSGFTSSSKTITINVTANCKNITFSGSTVAPVVTQSGAQTLNIYGSSVWQSGMGQINVSTIVYQSTSENKTITSNGVITGSSNLLYTNNVFFREVNSISLLDDFFTGYDLTHFAGTFNTNGHNVSVRNNFSANNPGTQARIINLGSSIITLQSINSSFNTNSQYVTLNAGTSHIVFAALDNTANTYGIIPYTNQTFYDVTFQKSGSLGGSHSGTVYYNNVTFLGDGNLYSDNSIKNLTFSATKTYILPVGKTQFITNSLSAITSPCGGWSTIKSSVTESQAIISANSGAIIAVSGAIIQDINATGGALFNATNSVDNTNNTGWLFSPYTGQNLYWVGGSGNWNDKTHWSQTSGGVGGYCVPGPGDNVFFDAGSGFSSTNKTVTVDNISYAHNVTFAGSPVSPLLTQNGVQTLNIYGSSVWQTGMSPINISNIYYRKTGESKTITSNGVTTGVSSGTINTNIYFEEENSISLLDDLSVGYNLNHNAGTFNTNNFNVIIKQGFLTNNGTKLRTINFGSSIITFLNSQSLYNANSSLVTINAGTSHFIFTSLVTSGTTMGLQAFANQVYNNITFEKFGYLSGANIGNVYYNTVLFLGDGNIYGNNNFNNLTLSATKTYTLASGKTQTVNNLFSANTPQCSGWSTIKTSTVGSQAIISASSGAVINVSGVIMQDINANGGGLFIANNSVDNGNNTGWSFPPYTGQNLYWVGGSGNWNDKAHWSQTSGSIGGYCVPGPADNVFFDAGSGFSSTNKTVTVDNISYAHNITFAGSPVAPTLTQNGAQTLNIYGSTVWQTGMGQINIAYIYYRNTGETKTITSNGVITGMTGNSTIVSAIYFEEENSISLLDDFSTGNDLYHNAGMFNTNNYNIGVASSFFANNGTKNRTINLGSSVITLSNIQSSFNTNSSNVTLNAGTSHTIFTTLNNTSTNNGLIAYSNQSYYDITFNNVGSLGGGSKTGVSYNKVIFRGNGNIYGDSYINSLFLNAGKSYSLESNRTQTIMDLVIGGNSCNVTNIQNTTSTIQAKINVLGTNTSFNFANVKYINSIGKTLYFEEQSNNLGNNTNIIFAPYNPGSFDGLGPDWLNYTINTSDPLSYLLKTDKFYGNEFTTYKWYKLNSSNPNTIISTDPNLDLRNFGYGNYKVEVIYSDGITENCTITDSINITSKTIKPVYINPNLRIRVNK